MKTKGGIWPKFRPGEFVSHVVEPNSRGLVTSFMVKGNNHNYLVQWSVKDCEWHLDFELVKTTDSNKEIGFWSEEGKEK